MYKEPPTKWGNPNNWYENFDRYAVALLSQHKSVGLREQGKDSVRKRLEQRPHSFVM